MNKYCTIELLCFIGASTYFPYKVLFMSHMANLTSGILHAHTCELDSTSSFQWEGGDGETCCRKTRNPLS